MKLPKDLQKAKKGKYSKEKESNNTGSLIQAFKKQFEKLKDNFNDKRSLDYIYEIDKVSNKTSIKSRYAIKWNEEKIIISIFKQEIRDFSEILKKREKNINFIELHKQTANHEYGHILSAKTSYDLFPEEARQYDLFKLTEEQLLPMHYSPLEYRLTKVSIDRLMGIFWEFLADYTVREKIDTTSPKAFLKAQNANSVFLIGQFKVKGVFSLHNPYRSENVMEKGYDRFFLLFHNSKAFYIFNKWEEFCSLFKGEGIQKSLKLMKIINKFFEKIILLNTDIQSMKNDVIKLATILDRLDFNQLIHRNQFKQGNKDILRDYIKYLSYKKS